MPSMHRGRRATKAQESKAKKEVVSEIKKSKPTENKSPSMVRKNK